MKKLMLLCVAMLLGATAFAQQEDTIKDKFVLEGDLIKATLYHDNGVVSQTGFYTKENKLQGDWISYDREGSKTASAQYDNGQKIGKWFFWEGDTLTEVDYENSKIASVNTWKNAGEHIISNH